MTLTAAGIVILLSLITLLSTLIVTLDQQSGASARAPSVIDLSFPLDVPPQLCSEAKTFSSAQWPRFSADCLEVCAWSWSGHKGRPNVVKNIGMDEFLCAANYREFADVLIDWPFDFLWAENNADEEKANRLRGIKDSLRCISRRPASVIWLKAEGGDHIEEAVTEIMRRNESFIIVTSEGDAAASRYSLLHTHPLFIAHFGQNMDVVDGGIKFIHQPLGLNCFGHRWMRPILEAQAKDANRRINNFHSRNCSLLRGDLAALLQLEAYRYHDATHQYNVASTQPHFNYSSINVQTMMDQVNADMEQQALSYAHVYNRSRHWYPANTRSLEGVFARGIECDQY